VWGLCEQWPVETALSERFPLYTRRTCSTSSPTQSAPLTLTLFFFGVTASAMATSKWASATLMCASDRSTTPSFSDREAVFLGVAGGYAYLNGSDVPCVR